MSGRKHSALYRHIEHLQGDRPWGAVLDAGTGKNSIRWLSGLETERWTAVTGSVAQADIAQAAVGEDKRDQDQIVLGNWADDQLLKDERFDTVIADYLLGAIEGFAPYFQPYLFSRLRPLTQQMLYVTGLEPYVPGVRPDHKAARLVWEIGRFRDACVLLKGGIPYREYPAQWVVDQLNHSGFSARAVKHFKIGYKGFFVKTQINIALHGLEEELEDKALARALIDRGLALQEEALDSIAHEGALRGARNYVIAAQPI